MKRILSILLLAAVLLSAFSITAFAAGDDNAQSGDGDTNDAAKGYAWYNTYQYLWKVTLFVGKSDNVTKQSSLTADFHRVGTVIMKKTGWTVSSSVKFGNGTKVDYYSGAAMGMDTSPYIISDANCPAIPIACNGDVEKVKSYFGSTGTMSTVLNGIAADKGTTKEALLSSLKFTIGGQTKSGWAFEYVNPNATTNRVPWVIVYEPMVILNLKDQTTKLAFTATEFAICELNGWYDFNYSAGEGENCASLTEKHLPTSVQLEESWFGYPVYAVTDDSKRWEHTDIVKGGGWGMRWLGAAVKESPPEMDYGCCFRNVDTAPTVGGYGKVEIKWINYRQDAGEVLCTLYRGNTMVWSEWKTIPAGGTATTSISLYYGKEGAENLTCYINWERLQEEIDPDDNTDTVTVEAKTVEVPPEEDYAVYFKNIEQPNQDEYGTVTVWWTNWTEKSGSALCELYLDGQLIWSGTKTFGAMQNISSTYEVLYRGTSTKTLEARINYANREEEMDPNDNRAVELVTPTRTADTTYDLSVSDLSVTPATVYQSNRCTVSFVSDNWNRDLAYEDILVEVLVGREVVKTDFVDFTPYGRNQHTYSLDMKNLGAQTVTARINYANRNAEDNKDNNSVRKSVSVEKYYDFSVSELEVAPSTCYQGESVTITFCTDSWDPYNAYENIPVEVLLNDEVIHTEYVNYSAYGEKNHTVTLNVGQVVGEQNIAVRINWENRDKEVKTGNNITETVQLVVQDKMDLAIKAIKPNSSYHTGTTVITSFRIINNSGKDILPEHNNTVSFKAYYYNGSQKVTISSQSWKQAVIPAYDENLVYFKWTVPSNIAGKLVYCVADVNADGTIAESVTSNNSDRVVPTIQAKPTSQTPNTQYEGKMPEGFTPPVAPEARIEAATWSMWSYKDGTFTKTDYGVTISDTYPAVTPDEGSPSVQFVNGYWQMRSGYGFTLSYNPQIVSFGDYIMPTSSAYTAVQCAYATFPEFQYSTEANCYRNLCKVNGSWVFQTNPDTDDDARLHFTPLWYPNGYYTPYVVATEVWTPAGMISAVRNSNSIQIVDSAYDDWYVGEE